MYSIHCPICDIQTTVEVHYDDEKPQHCPMCGADADPEIEEDDEE